MSHQVNEWFASLVQDNTLLLKKTVLHGQTHARTVVSLIKLLFAANSQRKKSYLRSESEDEEYVAVIAVEEQLNTVASAGNPNRVFATLLVNGK